MQVWQKLLASYLVLTCATLLICAVGIKSAQNVRDDFHSVNEVSVPILLHLADLRYDDLRIVSSTMEYAFLARLDTASDKKALAVAKVEEQKTLQGAIGAYRAALALCAKHMAADPDEAKLYRSIEVSGNRLVTLAKNYVLLQSMRAPADRLLQSKEEFERSEKGFLAAVDRGIQFERDEVCCQEGQAFSKVSRAITSTGGLAAGAVVLSLLVAIFVSLTISRRIFALRNAAQEVAAGKLDVVLPGTSADEIGSVYDSFNKMVVALRLSEQELASSNGYLQRIIATMPDPLIVVSAAGVILDANPASQAVLGYHRDDLLGRSFLLLFTDRTAGEEFLAGMKGGSVAEEEAFFVTRDAKEIAVSLWASMLGEGSAEGTFLCICHDITQKKRAELEIHQLAYYDHLTGLPNRTLFLDRCNQAIARAQRNQQELALLFFDLDHFKDLNDTLGHQAGDRLLQLVAQRLSSMIRSSDTLARFGGDEFVLLATSLNDLDGAATLASKLLHTLSLPFTVENRELFTSASLGIVCYPHDGSDTATLLKNADLAMYAAKENGRKDFQFFSHDLDLRIQERIFIEEGLRQAMQLQELVLHYQPQVELSTGTVIGVEALARWVHPELGFIPPNRFIPIAEQTGMIRELGAWVLQTACAQCKRWHHLGYGITVAVNVSIIQLMTPGFTEQVAAILAETELEPEFLELELTESKLMGNAVDSAEVLRQLKALGVKIAIDDFGTGYSSLSYLKDFSVDRLKIDRSFVHELSARSDAAAIVMAIIAIGHNLGLKVIAEGIESVQEEEILAQYLCDDGQGFFYARPMGVGELTRYLVANAGDAVVEAAADAPSPSDASAEAPPWSGKPPASPARGSTPPSPPRPDRPRSGAACRRPEPRGGRSPHRSSRRP